MTLAAESKLGHYLIVSPIGAGAMGEVYLARDTRLDRMVAIKLLPAEFTRDANRLRRFEQEARAASALNHPNIVTIHEFGEAPEGSYIVMEHVDGTTLRAVHSSETSIAKSIGVAKQIAEALGVAHRAGIVHRDIKPANIMLRDDGYIKVLDFGLARLAPNAAESLGSAYEATNPGALVGTAAYMSPEQARGEAATSASDIFAFGIIFYELTTGHRAFDSGSVLGMLQEITTKTPTPPSQLNPEVSSQLEALIFAMLEKDSRLRPDAAAIAEVLAKIGRSPDATATEQFVSFFPSKRRLVGRQRERQELESALTRGLLGNGIVVGVAGEPGIGKTTLVDDVLESSMESGTGLLVGRGRCSERLGGTEGFLPWLEALSNLLRVSEDSTHGRTLEFGKVTLSDAMQQIAPTWYAQVAPLVSGESSNPRGPIERAASQEWLKHELAEFLKEASRTSPLALFFDDLHWADASTIDLLGYIAGRFANSRILVVVTYRPSELARANHPFLQLKRELQTHGACVEVVLDFLNEAEVARYIALEFPEHTFPSELADLIYAKTEGNPLFMVDLIRYLRDRGTLVRDGGSSDPAGLMKQWRLDGSLPEIERDLPASVRGMIERKLGQLSDADRRLLQAASVQGYEFDSAVIAKALELDTAEVEERLELLERSFGLVRVIEERELPDHTLTLRHRFVHVLYQNELYAELRPTRRASLSASIASALRSSYRNKTAPISSELAVLYATARNWVEAAEYFHSAARADLRRYAFHEAKILSNRGLVVLEKMPESVERMKAEVRLLSTHALAQMLVKGYSASDVLETYLRTSELCRQLGDRARLFQSQFGLAIVHVVRAEYTKSREIAEECMKLAAELEDANRLVQAHWVHGLSLQYLGDFSGALSHLEAAMQHYDHARADDDVTLYGNILNRGHLGRLLFFLGYADRGRSHMRDGIAAAVDAKNPLGFCNTLTIAATADVLDEDISEIEKVASQVLDVAEQHNFPHYLAHAQCLGGYGVAKQGHVEEGVKLLNTGIAGHRAIETLQLLTYYYYLLADALAGAGRIEDARSALDQALEVGLTTGEHFWDAEVLRLRGVLKGDDGEADLRRAVGIAREQGAKRFELRGVTRLAELLKRSGRTDEARPMLDEIVGWFTEGLGAKDLVEAKKLL